MLQKAITLAEKLHKGQYRKSGEPYISHPLAVSKILKDHGFSEEVQTAGILHDLCEDTGISNSEIETLFTEDIAFVLYALSKNTKAKNKNISKTANTPDYRISLYIRRFASCTAENPMVLYVKIADQIHNLSTMQAFTEEKKKRKIAEVKQYFLPIYNNTKNIPESENANYKNILTSLIKTVQSLEISD